MRNKISLLLIIAALAASSQQGIPAYAEETMESTVVGQLVQEIPEYVEPVVEENSQAISESEVEVVKEPERIEKVELQDEEKEITELIKSGIEQNQYMTLNKCLQIAIANNPKIKAAISNTDVFQSRIGQAKAGYLPRLNLSNGYTSSNPTTDTATNDVDANTLNIVNVGITQLLWDFGRTTTNIDIQKTNLSAREQDLKTTINQIVYDVKKAYFELLLAFHRQDVMTESVNQYEQLLAQAKAFYEVGSKPKIDVMTAEVNLSNAKLALIQAQNQTEIAFASLNNTMGLPKSPVYRLKDKLRFSEEEFTFENLIETAYENRPDFKSAVLKVEASEKGINLAKKDYLPSIDAFSGFSLKQLDSDTTSSTTDSGWNLGVSLDLPILNAYLVKKKVDEAAANYEKECSEAQSLENNLYFQVKQSYMEFIEAKNSVPTSEVALKQAEEAYRLAKGRYEVGVGYPIELKDAELTYRNAKLAHFNALYDYNVALAKLENVTGTRF